MSLTSHTAIEAIDLTKIYQVGENKVHALRQASFKISSGEFVSLMGTSGSGKSTLMHLLGCLDQPTSGHYLLDGEDVSSLSANARSEIRNRNIGFVFQKFNLLPRLSAIENVMLPLLYRGNQTDAERRARRALDRVGLGDRGDHTPTELSGGQAQRVTIARALVGSPRLILADEPTGNLDSQTSEEIIELFTDLWRDGQTILIVTHDADVGAMAERSLQMKDGRIIRDTRRGHDTVE